MSPVISNTLTSRWLTSAICAGIVIFSLMQNPVRAQVIHMGVKGGAQLSWVTNDDKAFRDIVKVTPQPGFNAGFVLAFKVKDRFFLHTEYLYSTKGKVYKGRHDPALRDNIVYRYIDVPILYNIHFKGSVGSTREFKWYVGAGPLFSYWLGGKGTVTNNEFIENDRPPLDYKIRFGTRNDNESLDVYMTDVRRLQLGVNVGGGVMLEPAPGRKVLIDLRMELGHSWLGTPSSANYAIPITYGDNLKARNFGARFSVMYLLEHNSDKKVRNKGKSGVRKKGRMLQRRN